jgi:hypothetical protein
MASTLAHGLNYIATQQLKQIIQDFKSDDDLYSSVSYPLIYANSNLNLNSNLKTTSPFVMVSSVGTGNSLGTLGNQYSYGRYTDLNKDKTIQKTVSKYFLSKILNNWLHQDFRQILAFVKISEGKPSLIRSMNEYKLDIINSDSAENIEKRIDYLENILINRQLVKHVLKKIVNENDIQWTQLNKNKSTVKKIFKKYLQSKLEDAVKSASKNN